MLFEPTSRSLLLSTTAFFWGALRVAGGCRRGVRWSARCRVRRVVPFGQVRSAYCFAVVLGAICPLPPRGSPTYSATDPDTDSGVCGCYLFSRFQWLLASF